jgi:hypothetical protein
MGIPFARWGARPFIVHPIAFPVEHVKAIRSESEDAPAIRTPRQNPIRVALEWKRMLDADKILSMAAIARKTGVSRARVTQLMNLLALPQEVISRVVDLTSQDDFRLFSERRLRHILAAGNPSAQLSAFHRIVRRREGQA